MKQVMCENCGEKIHLNAQNPSRDWVKVACSSCQYINEVSLIRLSESEEATLF